MTTIKVKAYRVREGQQIDLRQWPTLTVPDYKTEKQYHKILAAHIDELSAQQQMLYAQGQHAVLLIFQAMDAAGKDGVIRHVMSGVNPQGCSVVSFKQPSAIELRHDFLWRTTCELPERGSIGIFNRSYYEEVLITRVHPAVLEHEGLPQELLRDKHLWRDRYRAMVNFEDYLTRNGTTILKFFLHLSKDEQRKRFLERIDQPEKNWKFSDSDLKEREFWKDYQRAYAECLSHTSSEVAPWYIVPADDKLNCHLIVSQIILNAFEELKLSYPTVGAQRRRELRSLRRKLSGTE
jgi:PPK2 family polyphosphate:nucleotide phosphotransferase